MLGVISTSSRVLNISNRVLYGLAEMMNRQSLTEYENVLGQELLHKLARRTALPIFSQGGSYECWGGLRKQLNPDPAVHPSRLAILERILQASSVTNVIFKGRTCSCITFITTGLYKYYIHD
jgi:hypothetical protein